MSHGVDPDQTAHMSNLIWVHAVLLLYLNSSIIFGNYLQQTTSADDIYRYIFLGAWRIKLVAHPGDTLSRH